MRPLTLTMQAFGSYGKKTTIDFSKTTQNLFLVTGATGAGKTTIFDAIVFALYGEASSGNNKKDGDELQSQFVDFSMEPFVELVFSEGYGDSRQIYSVLRVPRHIRTKKKGSGTKTENEKVTLTMPDGMDYPEKIAQTNQKIEEIVGLTKDQFMQVGMIAQGEFMDILRASTKDKKTIFRKLFNTELYDDMVNELLKRVNEKKSSLSQIRVACQTEVAHVDVPKEYDHCEKVSELKDTILGSEKWNVVNMEDFLTALDELCHWLTGKKSLAEKEYKIAEKAKDESHILLEKGTHLQASYLQLDRAEKILEQCEVQSADIREKKKLIELIDAAYEIKNSYDTWKDTEKLVSDTERDIQSQNARLPRLKEEFEKKSEEEKTAKKKQESAFAAYSQVKERVDNAMKNLEEIHAVSIQMKKQETVMTGSEKTQRDAKTKLEEIEKKEAEWRRRATDLKDAGVLLEQWKAEKKALSDISDAISEAKGQANTVFKQKKNYATYSARYQQAAQAYTKAHSVYVTQNRAFFDAQAGIIAKEQLVEGQPCPVCGSVHHPAPHQLSQVHKNLSWEAIEELRKKANDLQKESEDARADFESQGKVFLEKKARLKEMVDGIYQQMKERSFSVEELIYDENDLNSYIHMIRSSDCKLGERINLLEEEGKKRNKDVKDFEEVDKYLLEVDEIKKQYKEKADKALQEYSSAQVEYASLEAKRKTLMEAKTYDTKELALKDKKEAEIYNNECRKLYESAVSSTKAAKTSMEQAETIIRQCEDKLPKYKESEKERFLTYKNKMLEKNLPESEWLEIIENHSKNEKISLQKFIDDYKKMKATAEGEKKAASEAIKGKSRPDMDVLKNQMAVAEEKYKDVKQHFDNLSRLEETNRKTYGSLKPKMKDRGKVIEEFERLNLMYSRLSGKISGSRMDIETYVQRYYLDRILHAANRRFSDMSGGQFELRMYDIDKAGEGRNHGLDLMVYSTVTDKEREIRTLSGGESFMAALSLALGMADQIQENSSSINLDVMFIDEGFGSLDDLSRNQAVKVLKNMADGSKLIGIISHVTELKQEIEDQLVITKDDNGSHHRWENS